MTYYETSEHNQILKSTKSYCAHCQKNQLNWKSKFRWAFETDITNIVSDLRDDFRSDSETQFWELRIWWKCDQCNILLCKIKDCWCLWHEKFNHY